MPKRGRSGVRNLYKKHSAVCRNRDPLKCDCPWGPRASPARERQPGQLVRAIPRSRAGVSMRSLS